MAKVMKTAGFVLICMVVAVVFFFSSFVISVLSIYSRSRAPWKTVWNDSVGSVYRDVDLNEAELTGYDLYVPSNPDPDKNYSLILYIHGGGFTGGDKADGESLCKYYTAQGYVCASVNYTVADGKHTSDLNRMYEQICEQVASIKEKTDELGYHVTEMAATGESAGGCLAMLYAYREPERSAIPVKFVFQMTGPASFDPALWGKETAKEAADFITMMSGVPVTEEMLQNGEAEKLVNRISPAALVNENTVPTIIAYGPKDKVVPAAIKFKLIEAFETYGVPCDYIAFPHSGHTLALDWDKSQEYADAVAKYLAQYFENQYAE